MNYLLYGTSNFLIEKEINKIIADSKIEGINISKYDLETNSIKQILEDANTLCLFDDKKLIIVYNSFIFSKRENKLEDIDLLEKYLKKTNDSSIIIFIDNLEKIDNSKKITKAIKLNGIIKELNEDKNINSIVKKMFEEYEINNETIDLLIKRVGSNLSILYQEIEKLKLYKFEEKKIDKIDILNSTVETIDIDIFKFIDNIINKNKKEAIKTYKELLKLNEEPIKIIIMLANKFRLMYQASSLAKKGYTEDSISQILKVHKYPVHLAIISGYKYNPKILLKYLNDLSKLDIGIKSGEKDKNLALELFILSL